MFTGSKNTECDNCTQDLAALTTQHAAARKDECRRTADRLLDETVHAWRDVRSDLRQRALQRARDRYACVELDSKHWSKHERGCFVQHKDELEARLPTVLPKQSAPDGGWHFYNYDSQSYLCWFKHANPWQQR